MGVGKVMMYSIGSFLTLAVLGATICFAWIACWRRRESGLMWLALAVTAQGGGIFLSRVAFSPIQLVDQSVKLWLLNVGFYLPTLGYVCGLAGWIILSRKKKAVSVGN